MIDSDTLIARRASVGGVALVITFGNGLFGMRFGRYEFDTQWTDEAMARAAFDEERMALSCGMSPEEEGSGWHRRS